MYPSDLEIQRIIDWLRKVRKDICKYNALSQSAFESTHHDLGKKQTNMLWAKMEIQNELRKLTYNIKESKILVSLDSEDFYVSNMHRYKLWTPETKS